MRSSPEMSRPNHFRSYIKFFILLLILSLISVSLKPATLLINSQAIGSLRTLFLSIILESLAGFHSENYILPINFQETGNFRDVYPRNGNSFAKCIEIIIVEE